MALAHSPSITTNGLLQVLDAANTRSYPGTGTTWRDVSGNGLTYTAPDGVTFSSNVFTFDGVANRFQGASSIKWSASGTVGFQLLTISMWVRTADTTGNFYSKPWNGSGEYNIRITPTSFILGCGATYATATQTFPGPVQTAIAANTWVNIVCWMNGSNYGYDINGNTFTGSAAHGLTGAASTAIGDLNENTCLMSLYPYTAGWAGNTSFSINGSMSLCTVYNRVLSASEIKQNFDAYRGRYGV